MIVKNSLHIILDKLLFILLSLFFVYAFYFQYSFNPIKGALPVFAFLIFIISFAKTKTTLSFYKPLTGFVIFILYSLFTGLIFAYDRNETIRLLIDILEFLIPLIGIYIYSSGYLYKFLNLLWSLWISIVFISISAVFKGSSTVTGAISVGTTNILNVNVLSSFISLGIISGLILFPFQYKSKVKRTILIVGSFIQLLAQINAASRRGVIVFFFLLIAGIYVIVNYLYKEKRIVKVIFWGLIFIGIVMILNMFFSESDSMLIFERFRNTGYQGDSLRKTFHLKALDLFFDNPIFGQGFGSVGAYAGMYSHSLYYELLACCGIMGSIIFFLGVLGNSLFRFYSFSKYTASKNDLFLFSRLMIIFILSIFICGYAVVLIYDMYFYVMLGLIFSASQILNSKIEEDELY